MNALQGRPAFRAPARRPGRERGAIAILVGLAIVVLVLALGLVVDLGHLYIAKTELQNATDACALAATRELTDINAGTLDRATLAGIAVAARNRVDYQGDPVQIPPENVTFSDELAGPYARSITGTTRFARCEAIHPGQRGLIFIPAARGFLGREASSAWEMRAVAVGRLARSQTNCAVPLAVCVTNPNAANAGLTAGDWYSGRLQSGSAQNGNYDWVRFDGQGASTLAELLAGEGQCNVSTVSTVDAEPGVTGGAAQAWNTRFGLYSGAYRDREVSRPDWTGYAYTETSWPTQRNAYQNTDPALASTDFTSRRVDHDPFDPNSMLNAKGNPVQLPGNPSPLPREFHAVGADRRVVIVPLIECGSWAPNKKDIPVVKWGCMLMLRPVDDPGSDVKFEFLGLVGESGVPCATTGFPGGSGSLVPALVQ